MHHHCVDEASTKRKLRKENYFQDAGVSAVLGYCLDEEDVGGRGVALGETD